MGYLVFALAFLGAPADGGGYDVPREMRYEPLPFPESARHPQQPQEEPRPVQELPPEQDSEAIMAYIYINSRFDAGMLYTSFGNDLDLGTETGVYVRYALGIGPGLALTTTYRHYDFENSEPPSGVHEGIFLRGLLVGLEARLPLTQEFEFRGDLSAGPMWMESHLSQFHDEVAHMASAEVGATARLTQLLRLRLGIVADLVRTEFHQDSVSTETNLSILLGFEIGAY